MTPTPTATTPDADALRAALVELTPAQAIAADALASGSTHAVAAEAANVARETVTRWSTHHPGFRAALDLHRHALAVEQADRARRLRGKALERIEEALDAGDLPTALAVLRAVPADQLDRPNTDAAARLDDDLRQRAATLPPPPPRRRADGTVDPLAGTLDIFDETRKADESERRHRLAVERLAADAGLGKA